MLDAMWQVWLQLSPWLLLGEAAEGADLGGEGRVELSCFRFEVGDDAGVGQRISGSRGFRGIGLEYDHSVARVASERFGARPVAPPEQAEEEQDWEEGAADSQGEARRFHSVSGLSR